MISNRLYILIFFMNILLLFACTKKIVKYEYIKNLRGYKITIRNPLGFEHKFVARDEYGRKIRAEDSIKKFIRKFNKTPFKIESAADWELTEVKKFKLSTLYYNGLRCYAKKDFDNAVKWFLKAMEFDNNIYKYTDILYLLGKSYYYLGEQQMAKESFNLFIEYSESITHYNLHYYVFDYKYKKIDELFKDAESYLNGKERFNNYQLALKYHKENYFARYKNRYYKPGFILGKSGPGLISISIIVGKSTGTGIGAGVYTGIFNFIDISIYYFYASKLREFYIAFPLNIYSDKHKRLGIKFIPNFYYTTHLFEENTNKEFWKSYPNFGAEFSVGYYINHYWLVFAGYKYHYYNKMNPYQFEKESSIYSMWRNNNFYIGNTIYVYKDIGITIENSYEKFLIYIEIYLMKFGFNFTDKKIFLNFLTLDYY